MFSLKNCGFPFLTEIRTVLRLLLLLLLLTSGGVALAQEQPQAAMKKLSRASNPANFVDLQPVANKKLTDNFGTLPGNLLQPLEPGIYKSGETEFQIGEKLIHLGSKLEENYPASVSIPIGKQAGSLDILHATVNGGFQDPMHSTHTPEGTVVGAFEFLYADGTKAAVDIIYGTNVRDWWSWDDGKKSKNAKLTWIGVNPACQRYQLSLRLFHTTIKNPQPGKQVKSLTYRSTMKTASAPFCVAMSIGE